MLLHAGFIGAPAVPTTLFTLTVGSDTTFDPVVIGGNTVTIDWDFGGGATNISTTAPHNVSVALTGGGPHVITATTAGNIGTFFDLISNNDQISSLTTIDTRISELNLNNNALSSFPDETLLTNLRSFTVFSQTGRLLTRAFDFTNAASIEEIGVGLTGATDVTWPITPTLRVLSYPQVVIGDQVFTNLPGLTSLNTQQSGQTQCDVSGLTSLQSLVCAFQTTMVNLNITGCSALNSISAQNCGMPAANIDAWLGELVAQGLTGGTINYGNQSGNGHQDVNRGVGAGFGAGEHLDVLINTRGWTRSGSGY